MRVELGSWRALGPASVTGGRLVLPVPPAGPGLYRFRLSAPAPSVYVGETEDLRRRHYQYANPGPTQRTNQRMNGRMLAVLAAGGSVEVDVCTAVAVAIGECSEALDLRIRSHRHLAEEAALEQARSSGLGAVENAGG